MKVEYNIYYKGEKINSIPLSEKYINNMRSKDSKLIRNIKNLPKIETNISKCKIIKCIVL